jgi:hypothetical protein
MRIRPIDESDLRFSEPVPGEALVVERDGRIHAAIVAGEDLAAFRGMMAMLEPSAPIGLRMTEAGAELHRLSERGEAVEEFDLSLLDTHPPYVPDER